SDIRLTKVVRNGQTHALLELAVQVMLGGAFEAVYTEGDNSPCIPTDTMKNTVYALARTNDFDSPEAFAGILAQHFLRYDQVAWAEVSILQEPWARITVDGAAHPHSFTRGGSGARYCRLRQERTEAPAIQGGIRGLEVIKTTKSAFVGFFKDRYTTLPESTDRIFATRIDATWEYAAGLRGFADIYDAAKCALLEAFAGHDSASVQHTIFAMGEAFLARVPQAVSISLIMPNQHRVLVNLGPFGLDNPNEIFIATSEPYGLINGTVARDGKWES
ncbi:MAG TPA: urate oxidase, partial [Spirochaetia bacterium]|nr:urate oxidase [Spirochaetia bacterium]